MLQPEKNSYKEFDTEKKNSCGSKILQPLLTFLMVRPLNRPKFNFEKRFGCNRR